MHGAADSALGGTTAVESAPLFELVRELRARIDELEFRIYRMEATQTNQKGAADE